MAGLALALPWASRKCVTVLFRKVISRGSMALNVEGGAGARAGLRPGRPAASNGGPGSGPRRSPQAGSQAEHRDQNEKGGTSRAIIQLKTGRDASAEVAKLGGKLGRRLALMNGLAVELPNKVLRKLADNPAVERIIWDRPLDSTMNRVAVTVGARAVQDTLGYTGAGIGVAVIDSGITAWHDDLTYQGSFDAGQGEERPARLGLRRLRRRPPEPLR